MNFKISSLTSKVPNSVSTKASRAALKTQKSSPSLLFGAGVVGVVATVVVASRATLKLEGILEEADDKMKKLKFAEENGSDKWTATDIKQAQVSVRLGLTTEVIKLYGPAVLIGVASIACLTGSHVIMAKRSAAITAAYAALEKGFEEYRKRVIDEYGPEKDRELMFGVEEREVAVDDEDGTTVETIRSYNKPSIYAREFNEYCSPFSRAPGENSVFLSCQQKWANDRLRTKGHLFLNDVYRVLGMPDTKEGAVVGWVQDGKGDNFIDFGVFSNNEIEAMDFVSGKVGRILLDFNVDGIIYDKI